MLLLLLLPVPNSDVEALLRSIDASLDSYDPVTLCYCAPPSPSPSGYHASSPFLSVTLPPSPFLRCSCFITEKPGPLCGQAHSTQACPHAGRQEGPTAAPAWQPMCVWGGGASILLTLRAGCRHHLPQRLELVYHHHCTAHCIDDVLLDGISTVWLNPQVL